MKRQHVKDAWEAAYRAWENGTNYSPSADDLALDAINIDPAIFDIAMCNGDTIGDTIYELQCQGCDLDQVLDHFYGSTG